MTIQLYKGLGMLLLCCSTLFGSCKKSSGGTDNTPVPPQPPAPVWDKNAMRGVWLTTTASTALDSRANIQAAVKRCKESGINTIFMVVYNNGRTMYPSAVMNNLIGKPILEKFNGRDPLKELIEEAAKEQIQVHAWFEYGFASSYSAGGGPILAAKPHWASRDLNGALTLKNGFEWLNPFHPEVQDFILALIKEVVTNYNVAGVQGDDRLPALPTTGGYDAFTIDLYKKENGGADPPTNPSDAAWINWRAAKLTQIVKKIYTEVKAIKPSTVVSFSPSVYPWGKQEYLQDWPAWVDSGWVDVLIPQVYRYDITAYNNTLVQQKSYFKSSTTKFYPGVLLRVGSYIAPADFLSQMISTNRTQQCSGEVFFFYEGLQERANWFQQIYPQIK
jgi:uncharacterized lipoprotein YddW (UPF0748 family)